MNKLSWLKRVTGTRTVIRAALVMAVGWLGAGCGPGGKPPEALAAEEIPGAVQTAFQEGPVPEVQQAVREVLAAVEAGDDARAYLLLQSLLERRDLTPEQRETTTRAMVSVAQRLQAAAESGDESAESVVNVHQANK